MPNPSPSPLSLALTYFRTCAGWSKARLAQAVGHSDKSLISAYERGVKPLTREMLDSLVETLGYPPAAVDIFLFAHGLIHPEHPEEVPSPVALSSEEHRLMGRAAMVAAWTAGRIAVEDVRAELIRKKIDSERRRVEDFFQQLMVLTRQERRGLVEAFPAYWSQALAVRVCEESLRKAAHKAEEALELAELALSIAERVSGGRHLRLKGYCWAHVGNARRVANDHSGADEAFTRTWDLWRAGDDSSPESLAEWRLYDLEASLRRDERRFSESLELLDQARAACEDDPIAIGRILLNREHVFEQMGDIQNALVVLKKAAPFVEASGDARQLFAFRFKSANHLHHLERYEEAAKLLPQVREMAVQQGNELDILRLLWLSAKVAAGQDRTEEAIAGLEQVSRDFRSRGMPYDAALSSLDLSVLWLKAGCTTKVRELAVAMGSIFKAKKIDREALAALRIFCDAARQESATVELARSVITEIEQVRRSASPGSKERGRG